MPLEITHREQEGIEIFKLEGRLRIGEEDLTLRRELDKAVAAGKVRVVMDLGGIAEIDTAGVGTLMYAESTLRRAGGGLALAKLGFAHIELLILTKLEMVFEVYGHEQDAIDSFFPKRCVKPYDLLQLVGKIQTKVRHS